MIVAVFGTSLVGCVSTNQAHPNIVIVVTDDQGWGDFGLNGNRIIETPTIDQLAAEGALFEHFYVSPVCSSTRASLLTGRHFLRTGVWSVTRGGEKFRDSEITIAEHFRAAGYRTGLFGKWHNGAQYPHRPIDQGFGEFFGFMGGHLTRYTDADLLHNERTVKTQGFVTDAYTDAAIDFMTEDTDQPFLALVTFDTPHSPFELRSGDFAHFKRKGLNDVDAAIYGLIKDIDNNLGRVLSALEKHEIDDETIVVFLSDNGPAYSGGSKRFNGQWRGKKGNLTEGGIRVPMIVRWPAAIKAGIRVPALAQHIDILPTLAELAEVPLKDTGRIDGVSLVKSLNGQPDSERMLFSSHFRNTQREHQQAIFPWPGVVHFRDWTAVLESENNWALYRLSEDPAQSRNLGADQPALLEKLSSAYDQYFEDVTEGGFATLPPVMAQVDSVVLPAHEALIRGPGFDYAGKAGWAGDWIVETDQTGGSVVWPIRVPEKTRLSIRLAYAAHQPNARIEVSVETTSRTIPLAVYEPREIPGQRVYETGEAPEMTWNTSAVSDFELDPGDYEVTLSKPKGGLRIKAAIIEIQTATEN
ncbi:MAG: arylsulfatase [Pseudomonadota bacterium]